MSGGLTLESQEECARRLSALVQRINGFLATQLRKIEQVCSHLEREAADHAAFEQMSRKLRQQQVLWEQQKAEDAERIAEELEILKSAWDRIEAERRCQLTDEGDAASSDTVVDTVSTPPAQPTPAQPSTVSFFDFESSVTGRSAALQFQQIKREIRQHARRNPS